MKTVAFYTLGCKVNQYETNGMIKKFIDKGYKEVSFNEAADVYVINTCSVTNMSDRKSRQMIRKAKKANPNSMVVATRVLYGSVKRRSWKNKRSGPYNTKQW